jgi:hypothetical protein
MRCIDVHNWMLKYVRKLVFSIKLAGNFAKS